MGNVTLSEGDEDNHPDDGQIEGDFELQRNEIQRRRRRRTPLQHGGAKSPIIQLKKLIKTMKQMN